MNVLVVPGTNRCASEIINSLSSMKDVKLFGGGSDLASASEYPYEKYFYLSDISDKKAALENLKAIFADNTNSIDYVILTHDQWIYEARNLELPGARIIKHNFKAIEIASFKSKTYEFLKEIIRVPEIYKSKEEVRSFPIFAKPDRGQGSRGSMVINSPVELDRYANEHFENYVLCEYLPGKEFTIDCFSNDNSKVIYRSARERTEIESGVAVGTKLIHLSEIDSMAEAISLELRLCGSWFFQVKQDLNGDLVLMEIGLRIAGASGIQRTRGINLMAVWLFQENNAEVQIINSNVDSEIRKISDRKTLIYNKKINRIYVDLDDTIILPNKDVNEDLISALTIAQNYGIPLSLITRHTGDLHQTLIRYNLVDLFNEVHWIQDGHPKSSDINGDDVFLFIDDSFRERQEVSNRFPRTAITLDQTSFVGFLPDFDQII